MENSEETPKEKDGNNGPETPIPENAFLIIEGTRSIRLRLAVTRIGRSLDNAVVIDDPRVSRHHAELHVLNDQFVLFDLNSSGGTFINGKRTSQAVLYHGDRISLAGVNLHFTQDMPIPSRDRRRDMPISPMGGQRATAFFNSSLFNKRKKGGS